MRMHGSDRQHYLQEWYQLITAVETDDCATVVRLRGQFSGQRLGGALVEAARYNSVNVLAEFFNNPIGCSVTYLHDAVMRSSETGSADALQLVLQHTDPTRTAIYTLALWSTLVHNHPQCVDLLFDLSNTDDVLRLAHERGKKHNGAWDAFEQKIAERQRTVLTQEVGRTSDARGVRKM